MNVKMLLSCTIKEKTWAEKTVNSENQHWNSNIGIWLGGSQVKPRQLQNPSVASICAPARTGISGGARKLAQVDQIKMVASN